MKTKRNKKKGNVRTYDGLTPLCPHFRLAPLDVLVDIDVVCSLNPFLAGRTVLSKPAFQGPRWSA